MLRASPPCPKWLNIHAERSPPCPNGSTHNTNGSLLYGYHLHAQVAQYTVQYIDALLKCLLLQMVQQAMDDNYLFVSQHNDVNLYSNYMQTSCFEYQRVEEDWRNDAVKLAWLKMDIADDRYAALLTENLQQHAPISSKSKFKREWVRNTIKKVEVHN